MSDQEKMPDFDKMTTAELQALIDADIPYVRVYAKQHLYVRTHTTLGYVVHPRGKREIEAEDARILAERERADV